MKNIKFILFLFLSITILSCSDNDNSVPAFALSNANIAGTYNMSSFNIDIKASTVVSKVTVPVSTGKNVGDTFQINFILNANGSYTVDGQYRVVSTITPTGMTPITNTEIIDIDDSGSFSINTTNNTINFISSKDDFLDGTFEIKTFNENSFSIEEETQETDGNITVDILGIVEFVRK
jgi:hypothetical protein